MLLDSNILIYAANKADQNNSISSLVKQPDVHISSITKLEVFGYHRLREKEESALKILLENMTVLPVTDETIDDAIKLRQQKSMSVGDAIIAATALKYELALATRNITGCINQSADAPSHYLNRQNQAANASSI